MGLISDVLGAIGSLAFEEGRGDLREAEALVAGSAADDSAEVAAARGIVELAIGRTRTALDLLTEARRTAETPELVATASALLTYAGALHANVVPGGGALPLLPVWETGVDYAFLVGEAETLRSDLADRIDPATRRRLRLVHDMLYQRQAVMGSEFLTGRLTYPEGAQRLLVGLAQRLQALANDSELLDTTENLTVMRTFAIVAMRADDAATAERTLAAAIEHALAAQDWAGAACCVLTRVGFEAAPFGGVETLNLAIQQSGTSDTSLPRLFERMEFDLGAGTSPELLEDLAQADAWYERAGCKRGLAMVALHRGYLAFRADDYADLYAHAEHAADLFAAAGDHRYAALAAAHRAVGLLGLGEHSTALDTAADLGAAGRGGLSYSATAGAGFLLARAGRHFGLRRNRIVTAEAAYEAAEALFRALGSRPAMAQAIVDQAQIHARAGAARLQHLRYRDAVELLRGDLEAHPESMEARQRLLELLSRVLNGMMAADTPQWLEATADYVGDLMAQLPPFKGEPTDMEQATLESQTSAVTNALPLLRMQAELKRVQRARDDGNETAATEHAAAALVHVSHVEGSVRHVYEATIHGVNHDDDKAVAAIERYLDEGGFAAGSAGEVLERMRQFGDAGMAEMRSNAMNTAKHAAAFFVNLRRWGRAQAFLDDIDAAEGADWWRSDDQPGETRAWYALTAEGRGDLTRALDLYREAMLAADAELETFGSDHHKSSRADNHTTARIYLSAARAAVRAAESDPANDRALRAEGLGFADRGRSRALVDLMGGNAQLRLLDASTAALVRRVREADARVTSLESSAAVIQLLGNAAPPTLVSDVARARADLDEAQRTLQASATAAGIDLGAAPPPDLDAVVTALPAGAGLLTWCHAGQELISWFVAPDGSIDASIQPILREKLTAAFRSFTAEVRNGVASPAGGERLGDLLLTPFATRLAETRRLIVMPYAQGHTAPLGALPFAGGYLGDRCTISMVPSLSAVPFMSGTTPFRPEDAVLIVGNPQAMRLSRLGEKAVPLPPLVYADAEAVAIARSFGDPVLLRGAGATLDAVRSGIAGKRIIHMATHAHLDERDANRSCVLLADGASLPLSAFAGVDASADLIVLSACSTGDGELTDGDEILGLVRAALGAGARVVVSTLWPVNDASSALVMTRFYDHLLAGSPAAEGMAEAQREVRQLDLAAQRREIRALRDEAELAALGLGPALDEDITKRSGKAGAGQLDTRRIDHWAPYIVHGL